MLRRFRQVRTQTTRGKENSEIRSSAVTTIGKTMPLSHGVSIYLLLLIHVRHLNCPLHAMLSDNEYCRQHVIIRSLPTLYCNVW